MQKLPTDGNEPKAVYLKKVPADVLKIVMDEADETRLLKSRNVSFCETLYKIVREWGKEKKHLQAQMKFYKNHWQPPIGAERANSQEPPQKKPEQAGGRTGSRRDKP